MARKSKRFSAQVRSWSDKALRNADLVVKSSAQDVFEIATQRQPSATETGGSFQIGRVPVDTGFLVGTAELRVDGGVSRGTVAGKASTPPDFAVGLEGMKMGDRVELVFTAPYARRIEYGFTGTDADGRTYNQAGRLFVSTAVASWQSVVDANAALFRD